MKMVFAIIIFLLLPVGSCIAQLLVEPVAGYQLDLKNGKFNQFNSSLQFSYPTGKYHEVTVRLQKAWPISITSKDSAFSQNPAVPLYSETKKILRPSALSLLLGNRFKIAGVKTANVFLLLLSAGVKFEKVEVSYEYDKNSYTILNPDQTQKRTAAVVSFGPEYMRIFKGGRFFAQLSFSTVLFGKKIEYPSSFGFPIPLSFNLGYSIQLTSKNHEKK